MKILLGSQSPRRRELLTGLDVDFRVVAIDSDEHYPEHMAVTKDTLRELGADDIPCIHVFNKCDKTMERLPVVRENSIYMAAGKNIGLEELIEMISSRIFRDYVQCTMLIPYTEGCLVSYFNENASVQKTEYLENGTRLTMSCLLKDLQKYKQYVEI